MVDMAPNHKTNMVMTLNHETNMDMKLNHETNAVLTFTYGTNLITLLNRETHMISILTHKTNMKIHMYTCDLRINVCGHWTQTQKTRCGNIMLTNATHVRTAIWITKCNLNISIQFIFIQRAKIIVECDWYVQTMSNSQNKLVLQLFFEIVNIFVAVSLGTVLYQGSLFCYKDNRVISPGMNLKMYISSK